jgi:hypothetical protein
MSDNPIEQDPVAANGGTSGALRQTAQHQTARRNLLRRGGVVAAATVAGLTVLEARRAEAATGGNFVLGQTNDAGATTELHSTTNGATLVPLFRVNGASLSGTSTTMIVDGPGSVAGIAMRVNGNSGGTGIITTAATGASGTVGLALSASGSNGANAIDASSDKGTAVAAASTSGKGITGNSTSNTGVAGTSVAGAGVNGHSSSNFGVLGTSVKNAGMRGAGTRGGIFSGPLAQVQLVPGTAASHPASGAAGDLYVDKSHRLWFCRGGASWKQLA